MSNAGEYADLADIEAIRQLKARYFRTMDQKDWEGYRQVFTVDVAIDTTDDTGPGSATVESWCSCCPPRLSIGQNWLFDR